MMEPLTAPETALTGREIVDDVCARLAQELEKSCYLTAACAYRAYAGKITVELQLEDFDTTQLKASVTVNKPNPARPSRRFEIDLSQTAASEVRERSGLQPPSLERLIDAGNDAQATEPPRRRYVPRRPVA